MKYLYLRKGLGYVSFIVILFSFSSCEKFLDKKPSQYLAVFTSAKELQSLLDDERLINSSDPFAGEVSADDYYVIDDILFQLPTDELNMYSWADGPMFVRFTNDWAESYKLIYKTNVVLYELDKMQVPSSDQEQANNVKGHALLLRAHAYFQAATIWAQAYDKSTSATDLGLPLRTDPDHSVKSVRSSVDDTYRRIVDDLKEAAVLLPLAPVHILRPSRAAANALLARTYLSMREYDSANVYANKCLLEKNTLLDLNTLNFPIAGYSFSPRYSQPEIIMDFCMSGPPYSLTPTLSFVDTSLYDSYDDNDLRKEVYFELYPDGTASFRGSYAGSFQLFDGVATDEMYLIRAEANVRKGGNDHLQAAMADLNHLLQHRYKAGTFNPVTVSDQAALLDKILLERRKELPFRNLRFSDIKRLNKEGRNITPQRKIAGSLITLSPNSNKYALPIPDEVIAESGMPQNPR